MAGLKEFTWFRKDRKTKVVEVLFSCRAKDLEEALELALEALPTMEYNLYGQCFMLDEKPVEFSESRIR